jgi:hypothetical protein
VGADLWRFLGDHSFWAVAAGARVVSVAGVFPVISILTDTTNLRRRQAAARVALMVVALCAAIGCSFSADRQEAEQLAEQYFSRVQRGDIEGVLPLYSARFYVVTSRADWLAFLQNQRARCGTPETHSLVTWNVLNSFGTNAGITTTLVYDVQYSSCRVSEKMTLFKPSGGKIQIQGHFLNPKSGIQNDKGDSQPTLKT